MTTINVTVRRSSRVVVPWRVIVKPVRQPVSVWEQAFKEISR